MNEALVRSLFTITPFKVHDCGIFINLTYFFQAEDRKFLLNALGAGPVLSTFATVREAFEAAPVQIITRYIWLQ